jgi:hypothetical protein
MHLLAEAHNRSDTHHKAKKHMPCMHGSWMTGDKNNHVLLRTAHALQDRGAQCWPTDQDKFDQQRHHVMQALIPPKEHKGYRQAVHGPQHSFLTITT